MSAAWFEDEEFWRESYPYMFPPERITGARDEVAKILALTGFSGQTVLDLCCGPGRHSLAFAERGYAVTGVDRSPFLLGQARQRGREAGTGIEWVQEDMRGFVRAAAFDLACSLFTSFGYFEQEEDDLRVLQNVWESLRPGGIFVIDVTSKEKVARHWATAHCTEFPDGALLIQRPQIRHDWTRCYVEWTLIRDGRARTFHFEQNLYSGRELKDRLRLSGFHEVRLFGDLQGAPYGVEATRLVAVARKAG